MSKAPSTWDPANPAEVAIPPFPAAAASTREHRGGASWLTIPCCGARGGEIPGAASIGAEHGRLALQRRRGRRLAGAFLAAIASLRGRHHTQVRSSLEAERSVGRTQGSRMSWGYRASCHLALRDGGKGRDDIEGIHGDERIVGVAPPHLDEHLSQHWLVRSCS